MERRVVTAFFVDVVGSTALTVRLGPERPGPLPDRDGRDYYKQVGRTTRA
jgi:class 3 adenylate cyclase